MRETEFRFILFGSRSWIFNKIIRFENFEIFRLDYATFLKEISGHFHFLISSSPPTLVHDFSLFLITTFKRVQDTFLRIFTHRDEFYSTSHTQTVSETDFHDYVLICNVPDQKHSSKSGLEKEYFLTGKSHVEITYF